MGSLTRKLRKHAPAPSRPPAKIVGTPFHPGGLEFYFKGQRIAQSNAPPAPVVIDDPIPATRRRPNALRLVALMGLLGVVGETRGPR